MESWADSIVSLLMTLFGTRKTPPFALFLNRAKRARHRPLRFFEARKTGLTPPFALFLNRAKRARHRPLRFVSRLYRSLISMRFHPKSRASTDHAPGPSKANAMPSVPSRTLAHGSPVCEKRSSSSKTATNVPEIGVHRPARSSIPAPLASMCGMANWVGAPLRSIVTALPVKAIPATNRMNSSPAPGHPPANVENSRRRTSLCRKRTYCADVTGSPQRVWRSLFRAFTLR
jgi:hypothetical protein